MIYFLGDGLFLFGIQHFFKLKILSTWVSSYKHSHQICIFVTYSSSMIYVVHFQKQHHPLEIARHPGASIAKTFFLSPKRSNMGKAGSAGLAIPVTVGAETTIHHGTATALSRRGQLSLRTVWQASVVLPESLSPSTRLDRFKIQMMSLFISNFKIFSFSFMIMFELEVLFLMLECAYLSPTFSFIWLVGT